MFLDFNITLMQDGSEQIFLQQFCHMKTDFYKRYKAGCSGKYPNYENLLHHCCEHCQVNNNVCVTEVFRNNLSVLSSDGHLKAVCVCKFAHNMNIVITAL